MGEGEVERVTRALAEALDRDQQRA
jgi:hypothetical protein